MCSQLSTERNGGYAVDKRTPWICLGQGKLWSYRLKNFAGFIGRLDKFAESACAILAQF